jgi:hypothetical protein
VKQRDRAVINSALDEDLREQADERAEDDAYQADQAASIAEHAKCDAERRMIIEGYNPDTRLPMGDREWRERVAKLYLNKDEQKQYDVARTNRAMANDDGDTPEDRYDQLVSLGLRPSWNDEGDAREGFPDGIGIIESRALSRLESQILD